MTAPVFVDTNVLIYSFDTSDREKQRAADLWRSELWNSRRGRISFQVLQEFYVNIAHKWPAAREKARAEVRDLMAWRPVPMDAALLEGSWRTQDRYKLSFRNATIVAAAKASSCRYLLTEDLQADQDLDGVLVINPFVRDPSFLAGPPQ